MKLKRPDFTILFLMVETSQSGVYIFKLVAGDFIKSRIMNLEK
jgi:hypothetical protein